MQTERHRHEHVPTHEGEAPMVGPSLKGGVLFDKEGRRRGRKHVHVPIARKTKLGVGPRRVICCSRGCKTLRTDAAAHCKRKGVREERTGRPWISRRSCPDRRALASMRAPSRSGISGGSQQRGGARPGSQAKLPNSRKPSAMKDQVTEASISQSGRGEEKAKS